MNSEGRAPQVLRGFKVYDAFLLAPSQRGLLDDIRAITARAPLFTPTTPSGRAMSVRMTSAGRYGWWSDRKGYRYIPRHPSGTPWPEIPDAIMQVWWAVSGVKRAPDCCLINYYGEGTKMGMHQDKDEASFDWPVVSISLGDSALFRIGNQSRGGKTESLWLRSGDVAVMGGAARLTYHGVDRIDFGSSQLLARGGRINLTLRVVD